MHFNEEYIKIKVMILRKHKKRDVLVDFEYLKNFQSAALADSMI